MVLRIKVDTSDVIKALRYMSDTQAPMVTAYALTKTAQDIKEQEIKTMGEVFDRPTRFTLNSLYVKPATKAELFAEVNFKDGGGFVPAWRYLGPEVQGGPRKHKAFELRLIRQGLMKADEYAVPGKDVKLDQYGNISGSTIERILSQLGAAEQFAGYQANRTSRSAKRAKKKKVGRYFLLRPDGSGRASRNVAPGIYYRAGAKDIVPVLMFVRAPTYGPRFPFYEVAQKTFDERFLQRAQEGWARFVGNRK